MCSIKYSLCRLCLCRGGSLMDICEENGNLDFVIEDAIQDLLRFKVIKEDGFPWNVCNNCLEKLADFRLFKKRCVECKVTFESRVYEDHWSRKSSYESEEGSIESIADSPRANGGRGVAGDGIDKAEHCNGPGDKDWSVTIIKEEREGTGVPGEHPGGKGRETSKATEESSEEEDTTTLAESLLANASKSSTLNSTLSIDVQGLNGGTCFKFLPPDTNINGDDMDETGRGSKTDGFEDAENPYKTMYSTELFGDVVDEEPSPSEGQEVASRKARAISKSSKELTPQVRAKMVAMVLEGSTISEVAREVGVSDSCVRWWVERSRDGEGQFRSRQRTGRPRSTTRAVDEAIKRSQDKRVEALMKELGCSLTTLRHRMKEFGGRRHLSSRKKVLTEEEKLSRLRFALTYANLDRAFWDLAIFSGVKTFSVHKCGKIQLCRPRRTRLEPQYSKEGQDLGQIVMSFWGAMSSAGVGPLVRMSPTMRSSDYVDVLETYLVPFAEQVVPDGEDVVFVNEKQYLRNTSLAHNFFKCNRRFQVLTWPADSADLNPLEEVWGLVIRNWTVGPNRSEEALEIHIQATWEHLRGKPQMCENFVGAFQERLQEVIELEGDAILMTN